MFELPQDVDPGEAIVATIGVVPLIHGKAERISAESWRDVERIGKHCDGLARELVAGKLSKVSTVPVDYDKTLDAFSEPIDPSVFDPIIKEIPVSLHEAISAMASVAGHAIAYLESKFPISVVKTVCGNVNLQPSDFALGMFEDLLEIVDSPLSVYEMVSAGRLTSDQALALQTVYPSLYSRIVGSIVLRIIAVKADDREWDCEWERGLAVLLAVPGLDPSIKTALAIPPTNQPQIKQAAQSQAAQARPATQTATASQKVDAQLQNG